VENSAQALSALQTLQALQIGGQVRTLSTALDQVLPLRSDISQLFPWGGLKRGTVVETLSPALAFVLLAEATTQGSWVAVVGSSELGLAAARDYGVALQRLVIVHRPAPDRVATVLAALVDALDIVVVGPKLVERGVDVRRLSARARERGSVLLSLGGWLEGPDISLHVRSQNFNGLAGGLSGHGHIGYWSVDIETSGRGAASRPRNCRMLLSASNETACAPKDSLTLPNMISTEQVGLSQVFSKTSQEQSAVSKTNTHTYHNLEEIEFETHDQAVSLDRAV
jgi:hypothetical protein